MIHGFNPDPTQHTFFHTGSDILHYAWNNLVHDVEVNGGRKRNYNFIVVNWSASCAQQGGFPIPPCANGGACGPYMNGFEFPSHVTGRVGVQVGLALNMLLQRLAIDPQSVV